MDDIILQNQTEAMASYADRHGLHGLFQDMLAKSLINKPDDIYGFFIDHLSKPRVPEFIIIGPPGNQISKIAELIANTHKAIFISSHELIKTAVTRGNSYGNQARPFIEKKQMVPDNIMAGLVTARLKDPDVVSHGYVLYGYPKTKEQARALQRAGILPLHVVALEIPDHVTLARCAGLRTDPLTGQVYHQTLNPPPSDPEIIDRLVEKIDDSEEGITYQLELYQRHINPVMSCFPENLRCFTFKDGIYLKEKQVVNEICKYLGEQHIARYPREYKVVINGLPGSGKSLVAEKISKRYGFVHVSTKNIILEQVSAKGIYSNTLEPYINNPDEAPREMIIELIVEKLKSKDCVENGWVLDGFPNSLDEANYIKENGILPNRVFWLDVNKQECIDRLKNRRYDLATAKQVRLTALTPTTINLAQNPADVEELVISRVEKAAGVKEELEKAYGYRTSQTCMGIMQDVDVDYLGKDVSPEKMYEMVNSLLLRPVPIVFKGEIAGSTTAA